MALEPGIERDDEFVVEDRLLTDIGGSIGVRVLSTPGMIGMMERCARSCRSRTSPRERRRSGSRCA